MRLFQYAVITLCCILLASGLYSTVYEFWLVGKGTLPIANVRDQAVAEVGIEAGQLEQDGEPNNELDKSLPINSSYNAEVRQDRGSSATHILPGMPPVQEGVVFDDTYAVGVLPGEMLVEGREGEIFEDSYEQRVIEQTSMLGTDEIVESTLYRDNYEVKTFESDSPDMPSYAIPDNFEPGIIPFTHPELTQQEYLSITSGLID